MRLSLKNFCHCQNIIQCQDSSLKPNRFNANFCFFSQVWFSMPNLSMFTIKTWNDFIGESYRNKTAKNFPSLFSSIDVNCSQSVIPSILRLPMVNSCSLLESTSSFIHVYKTGDGRILSMNWFLNEHTFTFKHLQNTHWDYAAQQTGCLNWFECWTGARSLSFASRSLCHHSLMLRPLVFLKGPSYHESVSRPRWEGSCCN